MSRLLLFENLRNTRDLGGMKTAGGKAVAKGRLYRSGHLADCSGKDIETLVGLVSTIIDFRTDGERAEQPDREIPGTANIHIPIVDSLTAGISREAEADRTVFEELILKPEEARIYMCSMYRVFSNEFAAGQYSRFLRILLDSDGGILWHCTAGKDRAGIASAIVEEILGVPREQIVADYLRTNEYLEKDIRFLTGYVKKQAGTNSPVADKALRYLFGAEEEYIMAYYDAVNEKYGNFDRFIRDGLGIDDTERNLLQEKYLEAV